MAAAAWAADCARHYFFLKQVLTRSGHHKLNFPDKPFSLATHVGPKLRRWVAETLRRFDDMDAFGTSHPSTTND